MSLPRPDYADATRPKSEMMIATEEAPLRVVDRAAVQRAIVQTLAYADVFDHPLTISEIHRYLVGLRTTADVVAGLLADRRWWSRCLSFGEGFFTLRGREEIVALRQRRAATAAQYWPEALRFGQWIASLPFVRMTAITGALPMDSVEDRDIDFLVVTETGRLWLCRAMVILL